jgi:hypothetical protein
MFGLIAEDVEKVDPDLVTRNDKGEADTVRYEAVNAMLLNEFLKEHRKVEEEGSRMEKRDRTITQQEAEIRALTSQLQKVSDQLDSIKSARRVIASREPVTRENNANSDLGTSSNSESAGHAFSDEPLPRLVSGLESGK